MPCSVPKVGGFFHLIGDLFGLFPESLLIFLRTKLQKTLTSICAEKGYHLDLHCTDLDLHCTVVVQNIWLHCSPLILEKQLQKSKIATKQPNRQKRLVNRKSYHPSADTNKTWMRCWSCRVFGKDEEVFSVLTPSDCRRSFKTFLIELSPFWEENLWLFTIEH